MKRTLAAPSSSRNIKPSSAGVEAPNQFPGWIPLRHETYQNWCGTVRVEGAWICEPSTTEDVVTLANWAKAQGYRLRAGGRRHNFSPLVLTSGGHAPRAVVVDTTRCLNKMQIVSTQPAAVRVGAGATVEALLAFLESHGYGLSASTGAGDLTVGGVLAIGAHGTGVPAAGQASPPGHMHGTLTDLVVSFTAVVWDDASAQYVARTFERAEEDAAALLVHLGRAFVTEATLRVGANLHLRCVSDLSIPAREVFSAPGEMSPHALAKMMEGSGRLEIFWFPYTDHTWVKTWTVQSTRPAQSRAVTTPYNYPFTDNTPKPISDIVRQITTGAPEHAPELSKLQYLNVVAGLSATRSSDISGASKNVLLYCRPTTLRYNSTGYVICTSRAKVQQVIHDLATAFDRLLLNNRQKGIYPVNGPLEIRVTGMDTASEIGAGVRPPALSPVAPDPAHPEWDVAIWLNFLTFHGTPQSSRFYRDLEKTLFAIYRAPDAMIRMEWSKSWAHSEAGPCANLELLTGAVARTFGSSWEWAKARLNHYDPHRIFSNDFLDQFI